MVEGQSTGTSTFLYNTGSIAFSTVASQGNFTAVSIGYHTGLPEISVPFHIIQEGPLKLLISLSYHTGGVNILEPAGWVGVGGALNAASVITRSVMVAPDARGTTNAQHGHFSDFG